VADRRNPARSGRKEQKAGSEARPELPWLTTKDEELWIQNVTCYWCSKTTSRASLLRTPVTEPKVERSFLFYQASFFGSVHPRFRTPWKATILTGSVFGLMGALLPCACSPSWSISAACSPFAIVCAAVLIMRKTDPKMHRPFRCPMVPLTPILGIAFCLLLMFSLPVDNWLRLILLLFLGFAIYFSYGRYHSARLKRFLAAFFLFPPSLLPSASPSAPLELGAPSV
jgi:amino acid transporter